MSELGNQLNDLSGKLADFAVNVDTTAKQVEIDQLEERMGSPGFWDDQAAAQGVIDRLKVCKGIVEPWKELSEGVEACQELLELAEGDEDEDAVAELRDEITRLQKGYDDLEIKLALSGPYDASNVYMTIKPGAGGTDACDWAAMLERMYTAYFNRTEGYSCEIMDKEPGGEAGIKSVMLQVRGPMAYGYLKSEMGTHRLVRISPFNSSGTRETSFAAVEITPELGDDVKVDVDALDDKEFRVDTFRASGAGGQHVNKTDSAVRITHLPTGTVAACQSERSQIQNRDKAWKMMAAKLQQQQDAARLSELRALGADRGTIGWGHQIRTYVLHPYQLVKDLRTNLETSQVDGVLDGDLQPYIDSYLRWTLENDASIQGN